MTHNAQCTVLVVDDEPAITELLSYILGEAGMRVLSAGDGYTAMELMESTTIDVVLTDIRMKGMSGFDLLTQVHDKDASIKVIMMTGYDSYDMVKRALKENAYDYLNKPLADHVQVVSTVERAFESSRLLRENGALISRLQASNVKVVSANKRLLQLNKQLSKLATTDSLTQLYNRRYIDDWIQTYAFSKSSRGSCYSILLIDVDHFKSINDTHGHDGGDKVLRHLASVLTNTSRTEDVIGRYGGEEFIVVMPNTNEAAAWKAAERIRSTIEETSINTSSGTVKTTVSIGASTNLMSGPGGRSSEIATATAFLSGRSLVGQADKALYRAKDSGRNNCIHYNQLSSDDQDNVHTMQL